MTRRSDTIGITDPYDLCKAWDGSVIFRAFAGSEKDDEDDPDEVSGEDDGGDTGDGEGSSGTDDTDKDDKSKVRDPDAKNRSNEAAKYRRKLRETEAELVLAQAKVKEQEDKDKSDLELAERDRDTFKSERDAATARAVAAERQVAFVTCGAAALTCDPELVLNNLKLDDLEPDEDGVYDSKAILQLTEDYLKRKPHLKANGSSGDDDGDTDRQPSGRPANTRKSGKGGSDAELRKKYPALANGR